MTKSIFLSIYFEFQSTLFILRELVVGASFDLTSRIYVLFKRNKAWGITRGELLEFPEESLGFHLGCFLLKHNFEPQPHCENHDIFHVLTGYETDTAQEIALQFFLYGNGKRSPFLHLALFAGIILYPDHYALFREAYHRGSIAGRLFDLDYKPILIKPFFQFKNQYLTL